MPNPRMSLVGRETRMGER